jgi:hypothetical protein
LRAKKAGADTRSGQSASVAQPRFARATVKENCVSGNSKMNNALLDKYIKQLYNNIYVKTWCIVRKYLM